MIDICLLGCGGMMPLPHRALTSLYVRHQGHALLIDCGEGTQIAMRAASRKFKPIDMILLTHLHADHVSGLPGLLLTMGNEGRREPVKIFGPIGVKEVVEALCVIAPELPFEIRVYELEKARSTVFFGIDLEIEAFPLQHRVPCFGYAFRLSRQGKFDAVRAREKGVPMRLWGRLQKGECVEGFQPEDVLGAPRKGLRFLYATDTRPVAQIVEYGRDADLMILEGIFGASEKAERAEETCHMMMQDAAALAEKAGAKELWLTHFSTAVQQPEEYLEELREIFPNIVMGCDGLSKTLQFVE